MKAVVHRKAGELAKSTDPWPPPEAEGFASVMDCRTDAFMQAARRVSVAVEGAAVAGDPGAGVGGPVAATLAAWRAHVAGRKEPAAATGIQAFFKPMAAAGTGKAGTAGAGAGKAPLAKPAEGKTRPEAAAPAIAAVSAGAVPPRRLRREQGQRQRGSGGRRRRGWRACKRAALNEGAAEPGQTPAQVPAQQQRGLPPSGDSGQPRNRARRPPAPGQMRLRC